MLLVSVCNSVIIGQNLLNLVPLESSILSDFAYYHINKSIPLRASEGLCLLNFEHNNTISETSGIFNANLRGRR
ncbi:unnamed protein product [Porites evermanni]|uniref:Uncharacterized protein n=1 Tax=Porites evermanni TaxID=104178 RepID=A0ABN8MCC4_9CNID|nr:unnamed protein product [Porites evermanni]